MVWRLDKRPVFPDPKHAEPSGLIAVGGDLSVPRLVAAYRSGIFPWTATPITWWSPDPRGILDINEFHISRSLQRTLKQERFQVTFDRDFQAVINGCAEAPREEGATWISPSFRKAYLELHRSGMAHSVEVWNGSDLVGGVYGVAIGGFFAGESMFHRQSDASKVGLVRLVDRLRSRGYVLFDTQMVTPVTASLGARELPREEYLTRLRHAIDLPVTFVSDGPAS